MIKCGLTTASTRRRIHRALKHRKEKLNGYAPQIDLIVGMLENLSRLSVFSFGLQYL